MGKIVDYAKSESLDRGGQELTEIEREQLKELLRDTGAGRDGR
ncbi:hypothetical protein ACQPYK_32975 [Streptosporangium sp. CA-135522]